MIRDTSMHVSLGYYWCSDIFRFLAVEFTHYMLLFRLLSSHEPKLPGLRGKKLGGRSPFYVLYTYVPPPPPLKGVALKPFWSENGYRFFWNILV